MGYVNSFLKNLSLPRAGTQQSGSERKAMNDDTGEKTRLRVFEHCIIDEELVTHTGFEPMLTA